MKLKTIFPEAIKSRAFVALWFVMLVQVVVLMIIARTYIHASQLQVPVRFSAFADTQYFRDQWFYLLNFVGFGIMVFVLNCLVSLKLLATKGRHLALGFLWLSIIALAVSTIIILAILRVAGIR